MPGKEISMEEIVSTLLLLRKRSIGRYELAKQLGITEARTKKLIRYLKDMKLIQSRVGRAGTILTTRGEEKVLLLEKLLRLNYQDDIFSIPKDLYFENSVEIMFNASIESIGIDERDIAVRAGSKGGITLIKDSKWRFPSDTNYEVNLQIHEPQILEMYCSIIITFGNFQDEIQSNLIAACKVVLFHLQDEIENILYS